MGEKDTPEDIYQAWRRFDVTGDGSIEAREFKHVMTTLGEEYTDELIDLMLKEADVDGDGQVTFEDFKAILALE